MDKRRKTQSLTKEDRQKLIEEIGKRAHDEKREQQPNSAQKEEQKKDTGKDSKKSHS